MEKIIQALQNQGEHVAVFGTATNDLPIMQSANLSITRKESSPTVLDRADLIVTKNSLNALSDALQKGQRIVNSVMGILKLNLNRIAYTLILLVVMYITGERVFYFNPTQGGMISFFTIVLPSIALSLWASTKTVDSKNLSRLLFHFLTPSAVVTSLVVLMVNIIIKTSGAGIAYTQIVVTHVLVLLGLMTFVFYSPQYDSWQYGITSTVGGRLHWRLWLSMPFSYSDPDPLAQRLLRLRPLQNMQDYLLIFLVAIFWAVLVMGIWRLVRSVQTRHTNLKPGNESLEVANQTQS